MKRILALLLTVVLSSALFLALYDFDNKYTKATPHAVNGVLYVSESDWTNIYTHWGLRLGLSLIVVIAALLLAIFSAYLALRTRNKNNSWLFFLIYLAGAVSASYSAVHAILPLADKSGIAILLIHHLRKQKDTDPFNRISGTIGLSGAVDSILTLVEEKRGSGKATLSCIGRNIEYREMELKRNENNVWELISDSKENPDLLLPDIVLLVSDFMSDKQNYQGSPTEYANYVQG